MSEQACYVLPDVLPRRPPGGAHVYAHTAREHDARSMISFTSNALSVVLSGRKQLQHGLTSEAFKPGQAILFKPGQCLSTDFADGGRDYRSLLVFFTDAQVADFLARHGQAPRASGLAQRTHLPFAAPPGLLHLAESLWHAPDTATLSAARTAAKLEDVLLLLLENQGADMFGFFAPAGISAPQQRLKQVVEAHWMADLSWQELAFLCHMSLSTFKRHFQAVYGRSPGQWLHERRLHLAAHLLKVERKRASEIYLDVGFSTVSAFTQSFKSYFGMTPKVYQQLSA